MHLIRRLCEWSAGRAERRHLKKSLPPPRSRLYYLFVGRRKLKPLEEKARAGNVDAQAALGSSLLFGTHGRHDTRESLKWTAKALAAGNPYAKFLYGVRHMAGIDLVEDRMLAFRCWREAAEGGSPHGMSHTAWAYQHGYGVGRDPVEAIKWIGETAKTGRASAQYVLGMNYSCGEVTNNYFRGGGIDQDLKKAYFWLRLAAYRGDDDARKEAKKLRPQLTSDAVHEIECAVKQWRPGEDYPLWLQH
ncbi:MAG: tetratricopeptide repeat protein [Terriglobia bacterium]